MTPDEIAKLRALAGAATPWPWFVGRMPDDPRPVVMAGRGRVIVFDTAEGDTIYIAAACNAVPRLCDEIERLRGIVDAARVVAYRGEHTGDCIGASGGACFEDGRDECECGLTALRSALQGSE